MRYLLIVLILSGCAVEPVTQFDQEPAREVRIVWHKTTEAWAAYAKQSNFPASKLLDTRGFYTMYNGVCHIYAPDEKTFHTLGHEVKHCFDGRFHD